MTAALSSAMESFGEAINVEIEKVKIQVRQNVCGTFLPGQPVVIRDLESAKDLNGAQGKIVRWDAVRERYAVKVRDKEIGLKPNNLAVDTSDLRGLHELLEHNMPKVET
eukprot:6715793-Karenia_brevis.AAC.1